MLAEAAPGVLAGLELADADWSGLLDRPPPHSLCFSLSCAVAPEPLLGGGEGSAGGRPKGLVG